MIDDVALVLIGVLIGALVPFVTAWAAYDRSVHELIAETQSLRGESEELRRASRVLSQEISRRERDEVAGRTVAGPDSQASVAGSLEESIRSVSVERELSALARTQASVRPIIQPSFYQGQ